MAKTSAFVLGALLLGVILGVNLQYAFGVVKMVLRHCGAFYG